ncbi:SDR family NAD(P)-dependent oxidoreductase [Marinactinospora rubrisoli]|uniref:SDR family NAD(P)-dependent oxidoreductase n=1 Tax=Marinactinospora rubrisoli TaxID=2715399 RepID=A0ABW2KDV6_9ACTN
MSSEPSGRPDGGVAGRRLIVTGGGSGIGRAVAIGAARRGARVVVAGRRAAELDATARDGGGRITAVPADVADDAQVDALVATAAERLGGLDGVVNAAGVHGAAASMDLSTGDFARILDVNLTGAFRVSRAAGRVLAASGGGAITHVASLASFGGFPGRLAYGVAKAGLVQLVRTLAAEWGSLGVRVNAVAPGFVRTPIADELQRRGILDTAQIERRTPLRRRADPEDMVGPTLFLHSADAGFVTGECLVADGGWLAHTGFVDHYSDPERPGPAGASPG